MNYFFKSLWFGALLSPQCWKCAFMRNPMMPLLIAAVLFFVVGCSGNPDYLLSAKLLIWAWVAGMALFIILPRQRYKLTHKEKTLYIFIYDTYGKWKINVDDSNRSGIARVFERDGNKWRKSDGNIMIRGFDDSLVDVSGFLLLRRPYSSWQLLGNGYNNDSSVLILGHKVADYAFINTQKAPRKTNMFLLHGRKAVCEKAVIFEKCEFISLDEEHTSYTEAGCSRLEMAKPCAATEKKGQFLLVKNDKTFVLFKLINDDNGASAYRVFTDSFSVGANNGKRFFVKGSNGGYAMVKQ